MLAWSHAVAATKPLWHCRQEGKELASCKPQHGEVVARQLAELRGQWDRLHATAEKKGRQLFEANRSLLYEQSYGELERWLGQAEEELRATEQAKDLTATNLLLKRLTVGAGAAGGGGRVMAPHLTFG